MSMKTALMLGALIPLGLAVSLPAAATGPGAGPGHARPAFSELDADGDSLLTLEEMMARRDDDENGLLSANEMDDMRPRGPGPERMFARMDSDGDGAVSEAEFDDMAGRMMQRGGGHGEGRGHGMQDGGWGWSDDG